MKVTVHFGVEHSKNLNRPGTRGYFIKLTTRRQSVKKQLLAVMDSAQTS
jgi:hypothetical protein